MDKVEKEGQYKCVGGGELGKERIRERRMSSN